jgi:PAB1-binding protein PBP1
MSPEVSINAGGPSAGPLPSRPAIPSGDRPAYTPYEGCK